MAISSVGESGNIGRTGTITVTLPVLQSGDRMVAVVATNSTNDPYQHVTPEGWVFLRTSYGDPLASSQFASLYTRRATSSDSGKAQDFNVVVGEGNPKTCVGVVVYRGSTGPVEVMAHTMRNYDLGANSEDVPSAQINVPSLPATVVVAGTRKGGTGPHTWTDPAGTTRRIMVSEEGGSAESLCIVDFEPAATGTTTTADFTTPGTSSGATTSFAVRLEEGVPPALAQPVFRRWTAIGWVPAP